MARKLVRSTNLQLEQMVRRLVTALENAGYRAEIMLGAHDSGFDLVANSDNLGRTRSHLIQIKLSSRSLRPAAVKEFISQTHSVKTADEFWLVSNAFTIDAMHLGGAVRNVRLFKYNELIGLLRVHRDLPLPAKPKLDRVVQAISARKHSIVLMACALANMIDERIENLTGQRPNDPDRIQEYEKTLSDYQALKMKVLELQVAVASFRATPTKSKEIKKTAGAFRAGVEDWWRNSHNTILSSSFGMTLFVLGTALCAQLGVPPTQAAYLSAAMAGGNSLATAMKRMPKLGRNGD